MRKLAKGSIFVIAIALAVGFAYFNQTVEAEDTSAIELEEGIQASAFIGFDKNSENVEAFDIEVADEETGLPATTSKGTRYKATAYCLRGKTASGRYVRRGIVAADPRILRLGTRIHMTGGRYTGNYLVADTGGKIKGRILDIWVPSCREARNWGRRTVYVKVLSKGKAKKKRRRRR